MDHAAFRRVREVLRAHRGDQAAASRGLPWLRLATLDRAVGDAIALPGVAPEGATRSLAQPAARSGRR
jgi:hypothetical protein